MEIKIPKLTQPIDLGDYNPAMKGQVFFVWVNSPSAKRLAYQPVSRRILEIAKELGELHPEKKAKDKARAEALDQESTQLLARQDAWLSEIWSQGPEGTHFTPEEVGRLRTETFDTDRRFFGWMVGTSLEKMMEHLGTIKNASSPAASS